MIDTVAITGSTEVVRAELATYGGPVAHLQLCPPSYAPPTARVLEHMRALIEHVGPRPRAAS